MTAAIGTEIASSQNSLLAMTRCNFGVVKGLLRSRGPHFYGDWSLCKNGDKGVKMG